MHIAIDPRQKNSWTPGDPVIVLKDVENIRIADFL